MDAEGQELGPYEPVPNELILAAIERAARHGSQPVWIAVVGEHLGFAHTPHNTRRLRTRLEELRVKERCVERHDRYGRDYWSLAATGESWLKVDDAELGPERPGLDVGNAAEHADVTGQRVTPEYSVYGALQLSAEGLDAEDVSDDPATADRVVDAIVDRGHDQIGALLAPQPPRLADDEVLWRLGPNGEVGMEGGHQRRRQPDHAHADVADVADGRACEAGHVRRQQLEVEQLAGRFQMLRAPVHLVVAEHAELDAGPRHRLEPASTVGQSRQRPALGEIANVNPNGAAANLFSQAIDPGPQTFEPGKPAV